MSVSDEVGHKQNPLLLERSRARLFHCTHGVSQRQIVKPRQTVRNAGHHRGSELGTPENKSVKVF